MDSGVSHFNVTPTVGGQSQRQRPQTTASALQDDVRAKADWNKSNTYQLRHGRKLTDRSAKSAHTCSGGNKCQTFGWLVGVLSPVKHQGLYQG